MRNKRNIHWTVIFLFIAMLLLILDTKTAMDAMTDAVEICLRTVIPSLFPFFIISIMLTGILQGCGISYLRPLGRLLGIPGGCEGIFIIGLLGGYPVGAKSIAQTYDAGYLSKAQAERLLGFCCNAGPAFLFGMVGRLFDKAHIPWVLWGIHLLAAILVGIILPKQHQSHTKILMPASVSLPEALEQSVKTMGCVCGWIVLFRVIIGFMQRWFLWLLPLEAEVLFTGLLELANGCIRLNQVVNPGLRFILCAVMLSFGGICVYAQTVSLTNKTGTGMYFPGKLLQSSISAIFACILQYFLYPAAQQTAQIPSIIAVNGCLVLMLALFLRKKQNISSNLRPIHV